MGVSKSYKDGLSSNKGIPILRAVGLCVRAGEFVAIKGHSGAGKSTLLHVLGTLAAPDKGHVVLWGQSAAAMSEAELAQMRNRKMGFVFQAFHLVEEESCVGNVWLPALFSKKRLSNNERMEQAEYALERVGMKEFGKRKPQFLSGGQRQRIAIARALFCQPQLLLCDEPTGNLDANTGQDIIGLFESLQAQGVTIVVVTHEDRLSSVASRVLQLENGCIVDAMAAPGLDGTDDMSRRPREEEV